MSCIIRRALALAFFFFVLVVSLGVSIFAPSFPLGLFYGYDECHWLTPYVNPGQGPDCRSRLSPCPPYRRPLRCRPHLPRPRLRSVASFIRSHCQIHPSQARQLGSALRAPNQRRTSRSFQFALELLFDPQGKATRHYCIRIPCNSSDPPALRGRYKSPLVLARCHPEQSDFQHHRIRPSSSLS